LFLLGVGPIFGIGPLPGSKAIAEIIDETYSARPLSRILKAVLHRDEILAVYRVKRDMEYGLSFYREKQVVNYEENGTLTIPDEQHILVVRESYAGDLRQLLHGRTYQPLFVYPAQSLIVYSVAARDEKAAGK
jgi:hypothetical protein